MKNFWRVVNTIIKEADIILEVIDARFINETRNSEIEEKINFRNKKIIYIINKSDLIKIRFDDIKLDCEPYSLQALPLFQDVLLVCKK